MQPRGHASEQRCCAKSVALAATVAIVLFGVSRAVTVLDPGRPVELVANFHSTAPPDRVLAVLLTMDGWRAILPASAYGDLQLDASGSRDGRLVFTIPQLPFLSRAQVTSAAAESAVELALALPPLDAGQAMTDTPLAALRLRVEVHPAASGSQLVVRSNQPLPAPMAARLSAEVENGFHRLVAVVSGY